MNEVEPLTLNSPIFDCLYAYQRREIVALTAAMQNYDCVLEGGDTGTGKTHTISAACKLRGASAFVICPKAVIGNWFETLNYFDVKILGISNYEAIKNGKFYQTAAQFYTGKRIECPYMRVIKGEYGTPDFEWDFPADTCIIIDEAHKGKNNITITSQLLISMKMVLGGEKGTKMFLLSATITDKVECFRVPAYLMGLAQLGKHAYGIWLRRIKQHHPGMSDTEAIHHIVYPRYGSRMRIIDVKAEIETAHLFQANFVQAKLVEVSPEIEQEIIAAYNDIEEATRRLRTKEQGELCPLTAILRARQRIEMLKIPSIALEATEKILSGRAVVIFVNFTETITQLFQLLDDLVQEEEFRSFVTFIHGGQSALERQFQIDKFMSGASICMIANIAAANLGVSLHHKFATAKPRTSIISPPWSGIVLKQTLGRIDRAGSLSDAEQLIIYCRGKVSPSGPVNPNDTTFNSVEGAKIGVEEMIADAVNKKLQTIEWINNGNEDDVLRI